MNFNILMPYHTPQHPARLAEIRECLAINLTNEYIKHIYIFIEDDTKVYDDRLFAISKSVLTGRVGMWGAIFKT